MSKLGRYLLNAEEFTKTADRIQQDLEDNLAQCPDDLAPALHVVVVTPEKQRKVMLFVIYGAFNDEDAKHEVLRRLGQQLRANELLPIAAFLACECWTSLQRAADPYIQPSQDPLRQEAVLIFGLSADRGLNALRSMKIGRCDERIIPTRFENHDGEINESPLLASFYRGFAGM